MAVGTPDLVQASVCQATPEGLLQAGTAAGTAMVGAAVATSGRAVVVGVSPNDVDRVVDDATPVEDCGGGSEVVIIADGVGTGAVGTNAERAGSGSGIYDTLQSCF